MEQKAYIKSITRKLNCSKKKKEEIRKELESDINIARENGETLAVIYQRMGNPIEVAKDFNSNFSEQEKKAGKREKAVKITAVILAAVAILAALIYWYLPKTVEMDDSSVFAKDEVESKTEQIIELLNDKSYETLQNEYAADYMKAYLTEETMNSVIQKTGGDWGALVSYGSPYMAELTQKGKKFAVIQLNVSYENASITYRITFDEQMKLAGLYMW